MFRLMVVEAYCPVIYLFTQYAVTKLFTLDLLCADISYLMNNK